MKKYRIIKKVHNEGVYYKIQKRWFFYPFWVELFDTGIFENIESAEYYIKQHNKVIKYL